MDNVILFREESPMSPILKKGDIVRLVRMDEFASQGEVDEEEYEQLCDLEGVCGIIISIDMILPLDNEDAPGQAVYMSVAIPYEDESWEQIERIGIYHIHRVIGPDAWKLRGYEV